MDVGEKVQAWTAGLADLRSLWPRTRDCQPPVPPLHLHQANLVWPISAPRNPALARERTSIIDWWLQARNGQTKVIAKGIDSTVMLVSWRIWKQQNEQVFNGRTATTSQVLQMLMDDAVAWTSAGAQHLAMIGWPKTQGLSPGLDSTLRLWQSRVLQLNWLLNLYLRQHLNFALRPCVCARLKARVVKDYIYSS